MSYVKNLFEFINEGLSKDEWFNYKDDTYLKLDNPGDEELRIANKVMELLDLNDISKITFTSNNDNFNYDYKFFSRTILPAAVKKLESGIKFDDYVVYYTLYEYKEKKIVAIYIKDNIDISYIFIKQDDFEFFSKLLGGGEEKEKEEETEEGAQEAGPAEETPAE